MIVINDLLIPYYLSPTGQYLLVYKLVTFTYLHNLMNVTALLFKRNKKQII